MAATIILVEATPRQAVDAAAVTVRLAGGGGELPYFYNGVHWRAGIAGQPKIITSLDFDGEQLGGGGVAQAYELLWSPGSSAAVTELAAFFWEDAPITIRIGAEGSFPAIETSGLVLKTAIDQDGGLRIALSDLAADLKRPVLVNRFAGSGGIEGPVELASVIKSRAWGACFNIPGLLIDRANQIWCFGDPAFAWQSFDQVRDKGVAASAGALTVLAWQGSIAATFAALQAAAATAGGGVLCPSIACIKWWTAPAGDLRADIRGENAGGYVDTGPDIAARIVAARSTLGFAAGAVAAAVAARPGSCGWRIDNDSTTAADAISELLGGLSLSWAIVDGAIQFRRWDWTASTRSARSFRVTRRETLKPVTSRKLGYRRNWAPMARGDLADLVLWSDVIGSGRPETYTVAAHGQLATLPGGYQYGLRNAAGGAMSSSDGVAETTADYSRSYMVAWRTGSEAWAVRHFDVYGNGAVTYPGNGPLAINNGAQAMAAVLNGLAVGTPVVVLTADAPWANRLTSVLPAALYRCGASKRLFAGPWKERGAYILVGVAGRGEGTAIVERFEDGGVDNSPLSFVQASFSIINGQIAGGSEALKATGVAIDGIVNDDLVTAGSEKGDFAELLAGLTAARTGAYNRSIAINTRFGSDPTATQRTAMDTAYNAVFTYVGALTPSIGTLTVDTPISGTTFRPLLSTAQAAIETLDQVVANELSRLTANASANTQFALIGSAATGNPAALSIVGNQVSWPSGYGTGDYTWGLAGVGVLRGSAFVSQVMTDTISTVIGLGTDYSSGTNAAQAYVMEIGSARTGFALYNNGTLLASGAMSGVPAGVTAALVYSGQKVFFIAGSQVLGSYSASAGLALYPKWWGYSRPSILVGMDSGLAGDSSYGRLIDTTTGRALNARILTMFMTGGAGAQIYSNNPISISRTSGVSTITIGSHSIKDDAGTISYAGGSIGGLTGAVGVVYAVYETTGYTGATPTYQQTTNLDDLAGSPDRRFVGLATVPLDGASSSGGGNGGVGGKCVAADSVFPDGSTGWDRRAGEEIVSFDPATGETALATIEYVRWHFVECVRLRTVGGSVLEASHDTELEQGDGALHLIGDMLGRWAWCQDSSAWERVVSIETIGLRWVVHLYAGGVSFLAGAECGRAVASHNKLPREDY